MSHDPTHPPASRAEYLAVVQPTDVLGRVNAEHWVGRLYMRKLSPYISMPLTRTSVRPNQVTGVFIVVGWCVAASLLIPGLWGVVACVIFAQIQILLDCADGEVARWKRMFSPAGEFLDRVGHYTAEGLLPLTIGLRAADVFGNADWRWAALGAATGGIVVFKKSLDPLVQAARAGAGLPVLKDSSEHGEITHGPLATLKRIAKAVPIMRINTATDMSFIVLIVGLIGLAVGDLVAFRWLLAILAPLSALIAVAHFASIMASNKLKPNA